MSIPKSLSISFSSALLKQSPNEKAIAARKLYDFLIVLPDANVTPLIKVADRPEGIFEPFLRASFYETHDSKRGQFHKSTPKDPNTPITLHLVGNDICAQASYILTGEICHATLSAEQVNSIEKLGFSTKEVSKPNTIDIKFIVDRSEAELVERFGFGGSFGANYH